MEDWLNQLLSGAIGLITGVASGFYFERRQSRATRADAERLREQNKRLEAQVKSLDLQIQTIQTNITTHVGSPKAARSSGTRAAALTDELPAQILDYVRRRLDAEGLVATSAVRQHFYKTYGADAVEEGIEALVRAGLLHADARTVRIPI